MNLRIRPSDLKPRFRYVGRSGDDYVFVPEIPIRSSYELISPYALVSVPVQRLWPEVTK